MSKETSSRVSTLAAEIMRTPHINENEPNASLYNSLVNQAKTLAGSCLSQDETPGQAAKSEAHGIHPAPAEFSAAQIAETPLLHFFHYAHLPPPRQATSKAFFLLDQHVVNTVPRNADRTVALRKLLEAKDAAVRANLPGPRDFSTNKRLDAEPELGEPVETGGHDEDRDGPIPFNG